MKKNIKVLSKKGRFKYKLKIFLYISFCVLLFALFCAIFLSSLFRVGSLKININGDLGAVSSESRLSLEEILLGKNILFLNEDKVRDYLNSQYKNIQSINFSKSLSREIEIDVKLYEVKFIGCVLEEGFLIPCMYADVNGIFFKEYEVDIEKENLEKEMIAEAKSKNIYYVEISAKALNYIKEDKVRADQKEIDSIVDTRLYNEKQIFALLQYVKWLESMNYKIQKIKAGNLQIIEIKTDKFNFKISLNKSFAETVSDFEVMQSQDFFKDILQNSLDINYKSLDRLEYIDLSFRDKVFYKQKMLEKVEIKSVISTSTTATSTAI
jgi:cell division septal protein FtsQ